MHYIALATDYDGTIAHDGEVDPPTLAALEKARAGMRRVILVTGRELPDLLRTMPRLDVFDIVVAENGALLYTPSTKEEHALVPPPDRRLVERLQAMDIQPLSVGRAIVATWHPNEDKVLAAIRDLGLELTITFNKGAVMVLPTGCNKASGLAAALKRLDLSPLNCVAVGDAENDMAFLDVAGTSVAVANAVPALKERAAWVTPSARGAGVAELVERLLATDLADLDSDVARQRIALAEDQQGQPVTFAPQRESVLLTGISGGGKSTLTQGLTERLAEAGFQFCIIDPEGDYTGMTGAVEIGEEKRPPSVRQVTEVLGQTEGNVVVNLLGVSLPDRPAQFRAILSALLDLRARLGRPHFVVVDEAHHMLPAAMDPGEEHLPGALQGFLFVTTRPAEVSRRLLGCIDRLLVVGADPAGSIGAFCQARELPEPEAPDAVETGNVLMLEVREPALRHLRVIPGEAPRVRHRRKYGQGDLGDDKSFWFRGEDGSLNLRAQNLMLFIQMGQGVDEQTWEWHRRQGDYSRWIRGSIKDDALAAEAAAIEEAGELSVSEARKRLQEAIEARYTLPG